MEGRMYPCLRASVTYVSIANVSSCDSGLIPGKCSVLLEVYHAIPPSMGW